MQQNQKQEQQQQQQQRLQRGASTTSGSPGLAIQLDGDPEASFHTHADDIHNFGMANMPITRAEKPMEMAWLRFDAESPYISFDMQCSNTPSSSEAARPSFLLSDNNVGEVAQQPEEVHEQWPIPTTNGHGSTMSRQATSVSTAASMSAPTTAPASTATSESSNTSPDLVSINNAGHNDGSHTGSNKRKSLLASSVADLAGSKTEKASTHRRQGSVGKKAGSATSRSRSRSVKRQSPDSLRSRFADGLGEMEGSSMERANSKITGTGGVGKLATGRARPSRRATVGPAAQAAAQAAIQQQPLRIDAKGAAEVAGPTGALWSSGRARSSSRGICLSPTSAKSLPSMDDGQHTSAWPPPPSPAMGGNMSLQDFLKQPQGEAWSQHFRRQFDPKPQSMQQQQMHQTPSVTTMASPQPSSSDLWTSQRPTWPSAHTQQQQQQQPVQQQSQYQHPQHPQGHQVHLYSPHHQSTNRGTHMEANQLVSQILAGRAPGNENDLVQTLQAAFVLGLQQLGMSSSSDSATNVTVSKLPASSSPEPSAFYSAPPMTAPITERSNEISTAHDPTSLATSGPAATLNQQTADLSLEQFLSSIASTLTPQEEEEARNEIEPQNGKQKDVTPILPVTTTQEINALASPIVEKPAERGKGKGSVTRYRTTSITTHLQTTHLDDVMEMCSEPGSAHGDTKAPKLPKEAIPKSIAKEKKHARKEAVLDNEDEDCGEADSADADDEEAPSSSVAKSASTAAATPTLPKDETNKREDGAKLNGADVTAKKLAERRRKRRESHNAVERRRRDHINERIAELASLLPESMLLDAIAASTAGGNYAHIDLAPFASRKATIAAAKNDEASGAAISTASSESQKPKTELERQAEALAPVSASSDTLAAAQAKPNKGIILTKACEYTKILHDFCERLRKRNRELEEENTRLKDEAMIMGVRPPYQQQQQQQEQQQQTVPSWMFAAPNLAMYHPVDDHRQQPQQQQQQPHPHQHQHQQEHSQQYHQHQQSTPSFMELISLGVSSLAAISRQQQQIQQQQQQYHHQHQHQQRPQSSSHSMSKPPALADWLALGQNCSALPSTSSAAVLPSAAPPCPADSTAPSLVDASSSSCFSSSSRPTSLASRPCSSASPSDSSASSMAQQPSMWSDGAAAKVKKENECAVGAGETGTPMEE